MRRLKRLTIRTLNSISRAICCEGQELSQTEKKKALENLEQDAHQLMTASNEGMGPKNDHVAKHEPNLDEVVKVQQRLGEKPQNKPTQ
jgi:hypothetical protein